MQKEELNSLLKQYGITKVEFAKYLGIGRSALHGRISRGNIPDYWADNIKAIYKQKGEK